MANEVRLIDANALRKRMFSYYSCVNENSRKEYYRGETLMSYEVADLIEDCIDDAPTVDTVEVVHGRWIMDDFTHRYRCSVCEAYKPYDTVGDYISYWDCDYCPICGAKMDGGNGDG